VVWLAGTAIPGAAEAVAVLRQSGRRVVFLTNNSGPTVTAHLEALGRVGIECTAEDLVTSAQAAASVVAPNERVAVVGDEGLVEALRACGATLVEPGEGATAVVVGRRVHLDYWALAAAATAIRGGARFIAANTDATFPVGVNELVPGAGALVAFLSTASGRDPEVAGKPHEPMAALVRSRIARVEVMVGDRPDTDGRFARRLGAPFGLVLSGVTRRSDLPVDPSPDFVADNLSGLLSQVCTGLQITD